MPSGPLLVLLAAVLACSAPRKEAVAPSFAVVDDQATVYIYRPSRFRVLAQCSVSVDGNWLHDLPVKGYVSILVKPGEHIILTRWSDGAVAHIAFPAEAGRNYFFKIGMDKARPDEAGITISREEELKGEEEVRACSRVAGVPR